MEVNCSNKSEREGKQKVFTSHLLQITLQQKAGRRRSGSGMVQEQKAFLPRNAPRWELSAFLRSLVSPARHIPGKGWPTALGALVLPNDAQALSPGRAAFCLQAKVTVVAELVPYWRLILGEGEKSGQCGSH